MNIKITKAGAAVPKVEKRSSDRLVYLLDLSDILEEIEAATTIVGHSALLDITNVRTKRGKYIELVVPPSDTGSAPFLEYQINVFFETNLGNSMSAPFTLRVYK